ncbi:MAG: transposase [Candidatus Zixiibacteriota bacterium]
MTFSTHRRLPMLTNNVFRGAVAASIESVCRQTNCQLLAWVVMPEHVHLVLVPPLDVKIGAVIGEIKKRSAKIIHEVLVRHNSPLQQRLTIVRDGEPRFVFWMRRCFDYNCRTEEGVRRAIAYCHWNPVKRGMVRAPEDYVWSSAKWYGDGADVE